MADEMDEKFMPFGSKIKDEIVKPKNTITKVVTFPITFFSEFDEYAKNNSGHCYWLAIKDLIEYKKRNEEVNEQISSLMLVIENMNDRLVKLEKTPKEEVKKETKYFGKEE